MNRNSNTYTIVYSAVLVVLVAAGLALLSIALKEPQNMNKKIEKMQSILASFGKGGVPEGADKNSFIEKEYKTYVVDSYTVGVDGNRREGQDAFDIDTKAQLSLPSAERTLPIFVIQNNGKTNYVIPVYGAGLWGPIWGYVAIADDGNTIVGAVFDHKGETPGLGAEIATPMFYNQFVGKRIFEGNRFVSISVIKPGSTALTDHSVDGISGGTITSSAVGDMLMNCLGEYNAFLLKLTQVSNNEPVDIDGQESALEDEQGATEEAAEPDTKQE